MVRADDITAIWERGARGDPRVVPRPAHSRPREVDVRGDLAYSGASTIKTFLLEQASLTLAWTSQ